MQSTLRTPCVCIRTCIVSSHFVLSRCLEVVPAGAARAVDDLRAVQRLDPGLQVCIFSDQWWFFLSVFTRSASFQVSPLSICSVQDQDKRLQALLNACEKLPPANNNNFKWVAGLVCASRLGPVCFFFVFLSGILPTTALLENHKLWAGLPFFVMCCCHSAGVLILQDMEASFLGLQLWVALMPQWNLFYSWGNHLNHVWWNKDLP